MEEEKLFEAIEKEDLELVKSLLDQGVNVNSVRSSDGKCPLHLAIEKKYIGFVITLLKSGANFEQTTKTGERPIHLAVSWYVNCLLCLLEHGADINAKDASGNTALHIAADKSYQEPIKILLDHGAKAELAGKDGDLPIHLAATSSRVCLEHLLKHGVDVNARDPEDGTALHAAAQLDKPANMKLLLDYGANAEIADNKGNRPLHEAVIDSEECVKCLLEHGVEIDAKSIHGFTPLHLATQENRPKVIELLLKYGANVDIADKEGIKPFHMSAIVSAECIKCFLKHGIDFNARDSLKESTALHYAAIENDAETIEALLWYGADAEITDKLGCRPIHYAVEHSNVKGLMCLLRHKVDLNARTGSNRTPLQMAIKSGQDRVVRLLIEKGVDIELTTNFADMSPLAFAVLGNELPIIKILLENGANIEKTDKHGYQPIHHVCGLESLDLLLKHGASINAQTKEGYTLLHRESQNEEIGESDPDFVKGLLERGADMNIADNNGLKPKLSISQS